jgi:4-hydroxy-tetrahydrodipicolinate synthase
VGKLQGCIPIVATPFTQEGAIDEVGLRAEVEHLIARGVHGLAAPAIASEGYKLAEAEQQRVAAIVVETAGRRVPVVVSADGNGTDVAVMRARRAAALGAAALMVLPPMFIKPDGENLYRYYQRIARAVDVEIMVQDAPQLTGVAMPASMLARLNRDCPNITSVKIEGTPAGPKTGEVLALSDNRMDVFSGWGGLSFWEGLQRGAKGCMPAANFGPALARVDDDYRSGRYAEARELFSRLTPFISWSMQSVDLSVWCAKEALRREGIIQAAVLREPASLPDSVMRHEFDIFLEQIGRPYV